MELLRLGAIGRERPFLFDGDDGEDHLTRLTDDIDGAIVAERGTEGFQEVHDTARLASLDAAGLRVPAPVTRRNAVRCIGRNYAANAAEAGDPPPAKSAISIERPTTVVGPDEDVLILPVAEKVDREMRLPVLNGCRAAYLGSTADAAGSSSRRAPRSS